MKKLMFIVATLLLLASCKKEEAYGPLKLKNGQVVELQVGPQYGAIKDLFLLLPSKKSTDIALNNFEQREPGFTYRIKAKMIGHKNPPQGGPAYYFQFVNVLKKSKSNSNPAFDIALIQSLGDRPFIALQKANDKYYFLSTKVQLNPINEQVKKQLEDLWQHQVEIEKKGAEYKSVDSKWSSVTATVKQDAANFGKGYIVEKLLFVK